MTRIYLYDTTLRDGAQTSGVNFRPQDKVRIAEMLDRLGLDYIEGGWPGANPTDDEFFANPPSFQKARLCVFGMTRRAGRSAANDPGLQALMEPKPDVVTLVCKSSLRHAEGALGVDRLENLRMIEESFSECAKHVSETMIDAEHFFDGFKENRQYTLDCLKAALEGGAGWLVLCDTNGGTLPHEVSRIVADVRSAFPDARLGIHTHNDTGNAVANSLAAILEGATQIQGTINGLGERCGNANIITLIPTLKFKMGFDIGIDEGAIRDLTQISREFDEWLNRTPDRSSAYVGANAFAHKGGLHASAVIKAPEYYEHLEPALVGNSRDILISNQAGKANFARKLHSMGLMRQPDSVQLGAILQAVKERESAGFSYDGAGASLELLVAETCGENLDYFDLLSFRVIDERRFNARHQLVTMSEATIKLEVGGKREFKVADGNGPVNALDHALREALSRFYPKLLDMELIDYKVRILSPQAGTAAVTRVIIDSSDSEGKTWQTIGVSGNIIDASFNALSDAIIYKLRKDGAVPVDGVKKLAFAPEQSARTA